MFLGNKKIFYWVAYVVKKGIWKDRLGSLCCWCAIAQHVTGFNFQRTSLHIIAPQAHPWMSFFCNSLFADLPYLLFFSSLLLWFFKSGSAQLSMQYTIKTDAFSCSYFSNLWIFSSSPHFFSLFCFFCSLEPGFFLFFHTYCACCKHLLICNVPSETDCLFLSASIHSLFSNLNQKHRFFHYAVSFNFFHYVISFMPERLN